VLVRTYKQLHNEIAALFYARNSFSCYMKKIVPMQRASVDQTQYPSIRSALNHRALHDSFNISGGIVFPATRHHKYLTRLSIRLEVTLAHFDVSSISRLPALMEPELKTGLTRMDVMHHLHIVSTSALNVFVVKRLRMHREARHTIANSVDEYIGT
jgi:hypothetical protein